MAIECRTFILYELCEHSERDKERGEIEIIDFPDITNFRTLQCDANELNEN